MGKIQIFKYDENPKIRYLKTAMQNGQPIDGAINSLNQDYNTKDDIVEVEGFSTDGTYQFGGTNILFTLKLKTIIFNAPIYIGSDSSSGNQLIFQDCTFKKRVQIQRDSTLFLNCTFNSVVSTGKNNQIELVEFSAGSKLLHGFSAIGKVYSNLIFKDSIVKQEFRLENCTVNKTFDCRHVTFEVPPILENSKFSQDAKFLDCKFKAISAEHEHIYREIKTVFEGFKNEPMEHLFGGLELKCRFYSLHIFRNFFEKAISLFYRLINDYGISVTRPFVWLIVLFVLFYAGNKFYIDSNPGVLNFSPGTAGWDSNDQKSLLLSLHTIAGPFKLLAKTDFYKVENVSVSMFIWLQTILSSLIWFFLIFGIRRRFRTN